MPDPTVRYIVDAAVWMVGIGCVAYVVGRIILAAGMPGPRRG